ncbi:PIR protein [Plasmodium ovale]|uniref:PIR Superfamily Protein n=2 Tax=Plasmodium ovale TaxID=36330 RepID=A0A1A8VNM5_PLAOA|nr:PIR Superfamily Protein [Plasmodium ovale curtisi]SBT83063.1 PIR protein [Plasmodium ovale]
MAELEISKIIKGIEKFIVEMENRTDIDESQMLYTYEKNSNVDRYLNSILKELRQSYKVFESNSDFVSHNMYCSYLNYWLNQKKNRYLHLTGNPTIDDFRNKVKEYYTNTKDIVNGNDGKCEIELNEYSSQELTIVNALKNLCYIFKKIKEEKKKITNKNECFALYKYFFSIMNRILENILMLKDNTKIKINELIKKNSCEEILIFEPSKDIQCEYGNNSQDLLIENCEDGACSLELTKYDDNCNCTYNDIFLSIFFTILGTLLFSFVLYRFTPFGFWINRQIERKKNLHNKLGKEDMKEFLDDTSEGIYENSQDFPYDMSYHSLRN